MCGLILAYGIDDDRIEKALDRMAYRGLPGIRGTRSRGGWTLGHVRLPIQSDPEDALQPFDHSSGDTTSMAFVGEIFNWRDELDAIQWGFDWGDLKAFHSLDGFWAAAEISDTGRATAVVDHIGTKPLYYWPEHAVVCSEIEPMFALYPKPPLDEVYLSNCLKWGYDPTGLTPYLGIRQLPPGTALHFGFDQLEPKRAIERVYWRWDLAPRFHGGNLRLCLEDAIISRATQANPEVALLLSGGLDSSIIYYTLKNHGLLNLVTPVSIENADDAKFLPAGDDILMLKPSENPDLAEAVAIQQTPSDLGSLLPQTELAARVKAEGFHVCLSGDGADELFGGYRRAAEYDSQKSDVFNELPFYHLPRLDRVMMRSTIELRSPYLSPSVMALALDLPWLGRRTHKEALREVAFELGVPTSIVQRPKVALKSGPVLSDPIFHRKQLQEAFRAHYATL